MTRDGWQTASLAIDSSGIFAEMLMGQIVASERLIITNTAGNFIVDELGVLIENLKLTVTRQDNLSRITIDPFVGIKIQENVNGAFVDRLFIDNAGKVNATSFKVMNTNSILDDMGLTIFNGKISIKDTKDNVVFGADASGNLNLIGSITTPYAKMNKDGLTITGGKMQLINDAGTVVIDGEHNIHKIMMTGQTTITIPAGNTNYNTILTTLNLTDENGQPYIPVCHVYQQMDNGIMGLCPTFNVGAGTSGLAIRQVIRASADMSSLNLYVNRCSEEAVDPLTINVRYYVYKEMAF
jgi:hypothetical protein